MPLSVLILAYHFKLEFQGIGRSAYFKGMWT
jgi:hypothetical protein